MKLRPYQDDAVEQIRAHIRRGVRRVLCVAPTGAGKTVIASHVIECSTALGNRVLFLAHRRELINQSFRKIVGCSCRPGYDHDSLLPDPECRGDGLPRKQVGILMGSDRRRNPGAVVQVASVDTLRNRAKPSAHLIIVDEAHRTPAQSYRAIIAAYPDAAVIGLTATPYRANGAGLGDDYDELVVVASPRRLIDDGFLVEPRVFTVPTKDLPNLSRIKITAGDYSEKQLAVAVDQVGLVGNIVEHWKTHAGDRQTVVFAVNVEHSKHIAARFNEAGIRAEHIDGTTPTADRDAILARLERHEIRVVTNCGVLCEGWDQPSVKCCVLARPTKSTGLFLQQAGRILRPFLGLGAVILDHAGNVLEHGLPQDDREFTLETKKRKRQPATSCKTCPICFAIIPSSVRLCDCGHTFVVAEAKPLKEQDGKLVEVRPVTVDEKRSWWDACCREAIAKGYQKGWAAHRFKEKFGTWPPTTFPFPERPKLHVDESIKREQLERFRSLATERGYDLRWVEHKYRAKFGEDVPAMWLAPIPSSPKLAKAVNAPEPTPTADVVEWNL